MATERQTEANRRNAQNSTGPRTDEGKARSSRYALTHGMAARAALLADDEDAVAFRQSLNACVDDLRPTGAAETALIEVACQSHWRLDRCAKHERATLAVRVRHATGEHTRKEKA